MQTLTMEQVNVVNGGSLAGDVAMVLAIGWSSGVVGVGAGAIAGSVVPGAGTLAGGVIGGVVGFGVGALAGIGYALSQDK